MQCPECQSENVNELSDGSYKCLDCGHRFSKDEVVDERHEEIEERHKELVEEHKDREWKEEQDEMDETEDFGVF